MQCVCCGRLCTNQGMEEWGPVGGRQAFLAGSKGLGQSGQNMNCPHLGAPLAFRPITLTVAKCWDPSPRGCFTLPRSK